MQTPTLNPELQAGLH